MRRSRTAHTGAWKRALDSGRTAQVQRIEFRVLGPFEVWAEGRALELKRRKQRALLALLLLHAGEVVSTDRLIEELWAGKPPKAAVGSLQNLVSDLRKALGRDLVRTRQPGYVLDVEPEQVDLHRFERLVAQAAEGGDAERRSSSCARRSASGAARRWPTSRSSPSHTSRSLGSRSSARPPARS